MHRGLYQVAPPKEGDWRDLHAVALLCGEQAVVSHRGAARLHGFWGVDGFPVELTVPRRLALELPSITLHQGEVESEDTCTIEDLKVTTRERTLMDLAPQVDRVTFACMLESARRKDPGIVHALAARLGLVGLPSPHERSVSSLLADCDARPRPMDSPFEVQFWHRWPFSGLPMPMPQWEVRDGRGRMFIDFAWPQEKVAVETMGYETRRTAKSFDDDSFRSSRLLALGWTVIDVTYTMFRDAFFGGVTQAVATHLQLARSRRTKTASA